MSHELVSSPQTYVPAIPASRATHKYSWNKLPVALQHEPTTICGEARRIGYAGKHADALALYRLKIKPGSHLPTVTLPHIYVLTDGCFIEYQE
ncbi:MAG TPA: hypothetical protein DHW02_06060 [Ktedonobacter sp.]|nr:hypothetical protein [Ktedonobacter sp.]